MLKHQLFCLLFFLYIKKTTFSKQTKQHISFSFSPCCSAQVCLGRWVFHTLSSKQLSNLRPRKALESKNSWLSNSKCPIDDWVLCNFRFLLAAPAHLVVVVVVLFTAAILDDPMECSRGERLSITLAKNRINRAPERAGKAKVEVDIFELLRDSEYETAETSTYIAGDAVTAKGCLISRSKRMLGLWNLLSGNSVPASHLTTCSLRTL